MANYRAVAIEVGDVVKWNTSVNEIGRVASALFRFQRESFPNDAITSVRARDVYEWILSLARQSMIPAERDRLLVQFCRKIADDAQRPKVDRILIENGVSLALVNKENLELFLSRQYHPSVVQHAQNLFVQGNYFHAVFEAAKAFNKLVREKARSDKDGQPLMLDVWGWQHGVLKLTACETDTDKSIQDGVKFLSAGLMQAIRNPTAHEPATDWAISRQDCLDVLSFISFLFRQLDLATYYKA